jgi:hypothetical protein
MPVRLFQGKEDGPASGKMATIGRHDLHRCAGLLAQRGSHGRAWTLLEGDDFESLLVVTPPEPGGRSPSEVSPTVPDEPELSHRRYALHHFGIMPPIAFTLLEIGLAAALHL